MARGSAHSAPVIVDAAANNVVVCRAFSRGEYLVIKILGLAIATSVRLDALLVTATAGRASLTLAGRWNEWPAVRTDPHA